MNSTIRQKTTIRIVFGLVLLVVAAIALGFGLLLAASGPGFAAGAQHAYPTMAPLAQYLMANPSDEIALARSAAPASLSGGAEIRILTSHGYETAVKGKNGFVCMVERAWTSPFSSAEFWNYHLRGPLCFNPAAVQTVLPAHLERTAWALAGLSKNAMLARAKASAVANTAPAPGAMSYMLSKQGHLSDAGGHWHPHVMFWARASAADWGADLAGSPVESSGGDPDQIRTFYILVTKWSDGTPDMEMHS
jgi:hypothetical protein